MPVEPTPSRQLHAFRLDQHGLARVLGELEADIMEAVWGFGPARVADVCSRLGPDANYKTVMTVMNRLVEKRLLVRERQSRAFVYQAGETRDAFVERVSRGVAEGLLRDFGDRAVVQFVEVMDTVDPGLLSTLQTLVQARRSRAAPG